MSGDNSTLCHTIADTGGTYKPTIINCVAGQTVQFTISKSKTSELTPTVRYQIDSTATTTLTSGMTTSQVCGSTSKIELHVFNYYVITPDTVAKDYDDRVTVVANY